jgi:hypothetical protein
MPEQASQKKKIVTILQARWDLTEGLSRAQSTGMEFISSIFLLQKCPMTNRARVAQ